MEIKFRAPHVAWSFQAIDASLTHWLISTGRVIFGFQGAAGCEIDGPDCVALAKAYGGDGVRVEKAGELPAAIDRAVASTSGLFLLHVLIDPLLKADMAAFIDKAAMNSG